MIWWFSAENKIPFLWPIKRLQILHFDNKFIELKPSHKMLLKELQVFCGQNIMRSLRTFGTKEFLWPAMSYKVFLFF